MMGEMSEYYGIEAEIHEMCAPRSRPQPTATIWVTRKGDRIAVKDMGDQHLVNTIRMLRRSGEVSKMRDTFAVGGYLDSDPPDGAAIAAEGELNELMDMGVDDYLSLKVVTFAAMLTEAKRRNLVVE